MSVRLTWRGDAAERATTRALTMAGGDALRTLRTEASRRVRERKRLKLSTVRDGLTLIFPTQKEATQLRWLMRVSGQLMPVYAYGARQTAKGVTAEINLGSRKLIAHAFIATMRSGHTGVFMRYGEKHIAPIMSGYRGHRRYAGQKRQPIREAYTTKLTDVFKDADLVPSLLAEAERTFHASFQRLLSMEMARVR